MNIYTYNVHVRVQYTYIYIYNNDHILQHNYLWYSFYLLSQTHTWLINTFVHCKSYFGMLFLHDPTIETDNRGHT